MSLPAIAAPGPSVFLETHFRLVHFEDLPLWRELVEDFLYEHFPKAQYVAEDSSIERAAKLCMSSGAEPSILIADLRISDSEPGSEIPVLDWLEANVELLIGRGVHVVVLSAFVEPYIRRELGNWGLDDSQVLDKSSWDDDRETNAQLLASLASNALRSMRGAKNSCYLGRPGGASLAAFPSGLREMVGSSVKIHVRAERVSSDDSRGLLRVKADILGPAEDVPSNVQIRVVFDGPQMKASPSSVLVPIPRNGETGSATSMVSVDSRRRSVNTLLVFFFANNHLLRLARITV